MTAQANCLEEKNDNPQSAVSEQKSLTMHLLFLLFQPSIFFVGHLPMDTEPPCLNSFVPSPCTTIPLLATVRHEVGSLTSTKDGQAAAWGGLEL